MDAKICKTYEEALNYFKEYKKQHPDFKGTIVLEFNEYKTEDETYNEGLKNACRNEFSDWLANHSNLYDKSIVSLIRPSTIAGIQKFKLILEDQLYNEDSVDTQLFTSSIYNNQSSPCYINIFENSNMDQKMKMRALVHEYKNRFLCIEIPDERMFYFKGYKTFIKAKTMEEAEGIIHAILTRKYDIDYTRKVYGY